MTIDTIDPARSQRCITEAIACTGRSGDHLTDSFLQRNAGWAALSAGDIPAARAHLEAAAHAARQIGWKHTVATLHLGGVQRAEERAGWCAVHVRGRPAHQPPERRQPGLAIACLYLACVTGDAGDWHRAATLHGVAQAFVDRMGSPWQELDARYRQDSLDQARARLGEEQLERAYANGMALSLDEALDLALRRPGSGLTAQKGGYLKSI